ncbi:hypothetical protein M569_08588, partial [Genlisea aurea]
NDDEDTTSSGDSSATEDDDDDDADDEPSSKRKISRDDSKKKKKKKKSIENIDFDTLNRHGYGGGLSVLNVPPPKEPEKEHSWSWSTGRDARNAKEEEESYEERQKTRAAVADGEELLQASLQPKKNLSFQQKEKRKRDLGQASRGKNYVEEEKRLLRGSGIYSGFDS